MLIELTFAFLFSNPSYAENDQPACVKLADKALKDMSYGSFNKPRLGVNKTPGPDGSYTFESPGVSSFKFSKGKMTSLSNVAGTSVQTVIEFDESDGNCTITSVTGSSIAPGSYKTAKADPSECQKLRAKVPFMPGTGPLLTAEEQLSLIWCGQYFSNKPSANSPASSPDSNSKSAAPATR